MMRAALGKETAKWRSQFGIHIAFNRNDFNQCLVAAHARVQVGAYTCPIISDTHSLIT